MISNKESEEFFLNCVLNGTLTVSTNGEVTNLITGRKIGAVGSGCYYKISMLDKNTRKIRHIQIHRLMWLVHKGPIPQLVEINHIDGDKLNNTLTNLELISSRENTKHAYVIGLNVPQHGEKSPNATFSREDVIHFRTNYQNNKISISEIMEARSCSRITVVDMLTGNRYKNLGGAVKIRPMESLVGKLRKRTDELFTKINVMLDDGATRDEICSKFNISKSMIDKYINKAKNI